MFIYDIHGLHPHTHPRFNTERVPDAGQRGKPSTIEKQQQRVDCMPLIYFIHHNVIGLRNLARVTGLGRNSRRPIPPELGKRVPTICGPSALPRARLHMAAVGWSSSTITKGQPAGDYHRYGKKAHYSRSPIVWTQLRSYSAGRAARLPSYAPLKELWVFPIAWTVLKTVVQAGRQPSSCWQAVDSWPCESLTATISLQRQSHA